MKSAKFDAYVIGVNANVSDPSILSVTVSKNQEPAKTLATGRAPTLIALFRTSALSEDVKFTIIVQIEEAQRAYISEQVSLQKAKDQWCFLSRNKTGQWVAYRFSTKEFCYSGQAKTIKGGKAFKAQILQDIKALQDKKEKYGCLNPWDSAQLEYFEGLPIYRYPDLKVFED